MLWNLSLGTGIGSLRRCEAKWSKGMCHISAHCGSEQLKLFRYMN